MHTAQFTRGPWKVLPLQGKYYGTVVELSNDTWIEIGGTAGEFGTSTDPRDPHYPSEREIEAGHLNPDDPADWGEYFCDGHWESAADLANARLVAAAPDLYAALADLLGWATIAKLIDPGVRASIEGDPCWAAARAALARATEGQPR